MGVMIPASAVPIALLGTAGYKPPVGGVDQLQDDSVVWYMKGVVFSAFLMSVFAFFIKRRYPSTTDAHIKQLHHGLEAHKEERSSPDPVTGVQYKPIRVCDELQSLFWLLDHFRQRRLRRTFVQKHAV